jgi:hypothetical protein
MSLTKKTFIVVTLLFFIGVWIEGGNSSSDPMAKADQYLQKISDEKKISNEASAPFAQALSQAFAGEISSSEFIGLYPKLLNEAQAGGEGVKELCLNPPSLDLNADSPEMDVAKAMMQLAKDFCAAEDLKWLYVLKATEAASTLDQATFNESMTLYDNFSRFLYSSIDEFLKNKSVAEIIPDSEYQLFVQLRDSFKV